MVTNRQGWEVLPSAVLDGYAERGESENRNKEPVVHGQVRL